MSALHCELRAFFQLRSEPCETPFKIERAASRQLTYSESIASGIFKALRTPSMLPGSVWSAFSQGNIANAPVLHATVLRRAAKGKAHASLMHETCVLILLAMNLISCVFWSMPPKLRFFCSSFPSRVMRIVNELVSSCSKSWNSRASRRTAARSRRDFHSCFTARFLNNVALNRVSKTRLSTSADAG